MAKAKKSKKSQQSKILFLVSVLLCILFLGLAIGLAVRPYSTITPYTYEDDYVKSEITFGADNTYKQKTVSGSVTVDPEPEEITDSFKEVLDEMIEDGDLTAFKMNVGGNVHENIGNEAVVGVMAVLAALFLGMAIASGLKAFK